MDRTIDDIEKDIEKNGVIIRDDMHDLLKVLNFKEESIRNFLEGLKTDAIEYQGDKQKGIDRIMSDLKSYGEHW